MEDLIEKIKKIEALIQGATTSGEKVAAISARDRILKKFPELKIHQNATEYQLSIQGAWHKKLLVALCRKYGVKPYRYRRQKHTTVMIKINEQFLNKVLWKEYLEYSKLLENIVEEITNDLIDKIHKPEEEHIIQGALK